MIGGDILNALKFGIIGGDIRYKMIFDALADDEYEVYSYGNNFLEGEKNIKELLEKINILIVPIPCSKDDRTVFHNGAFEETYENLFKMMIQYKVKIMIGGVISENIKSLAASHNIIAVDFFDQEDVAVLNAIPTAEGAIATAMAESPKTIFGSNVIVLGYGRCGKILSNMLKGIGANVWATYRNKKDFAYIKAFGLNGIHLDELRENVSDKDFIFNTIPEKIVTRKIIERLKKDAILIDLAQAPGGVDFNFARSKNIKALYCPGLPGRVAPVTAAGILKDSILNISDTHMPSD